MVVRRTYAMPLMTEDVERASSQLRSALGEKGYSESEDSKNQVVYLKLGRFIDSEPTLRFTTRPPLSNGDRIDINSSVTDSIDIFTETSEE